MPLEIEAVQFGDDQGNGDSANPKATSTHLNDGETYACPASSSASYGHVPVNDFAVP